MQLELRVRHSKGISTVTIDDNDPIVTLQERVTQLSDVPPSLQQCIHRHHRFISPLLI